ncbi:FG-GAP repeat domain-containing protein [Sphingobacterium faecale]|uniref:VCBS repeat protein n=1 Tax=Sphingobacterium faecale TaxID=2803775 RepID=A0ABS1R9R1_9SPHI|nr:VCBS repeat-containing protein [Sphingobacterium faecale]MBL1411455.1 hypothetical protein [Sphingobacterium faecale]
MKILLKSNYITLIQIIALICYNLSTVQAQQGAKKARLSPTSFPELRFANIKGAPKLERPQLILGETKPVKGEGMGWASPAFYDVDGDGKKDLLIGEFASRLEDNGIPVGHFVRMYKNIGTEEEPKFNDFYNYLRPIDPYNTGPLSISTWCCLGFTPKLIDLDGDGLTDLLTGQYENGFITWFKGTKENRYQKDGFLPGVHIPQFGDHMVGRRNSNHSVPWTDPESWYYWNYSVADFGDFDGDGLIDMITGGSTLRISKNIGTKSEPVFGKRELLLDTNGLALRVPPADGKPGTYNGGQPNNGHQMVPTVFDWDKDGILDLLVTNMYAHNGSPVVTFFKGVESAKEIRFEPGVTLFEAGDGGKAFPGSYVHLAVVDWNNDGVMDLVIGTSVAVSNGVFHAKLAWDWESETKSLKKHNALLSAESRRNLDADLEKMRQRNVPEENYQRIFEHYYGKAEYKDLAHQGYIYVMLGKKERND